MDEQPEPQQKSNAKMLAIGVIALIVIAAISAGVYMGTQKQPATNSQNVSPTTVAEEQQAPTVAEQPLTDSEYKDGTYTAVGEYTSPGGDEELDVTITLKNDVITDTKVVSKATRPNSVKFQGMFVENYQPLVLGKDINEVQLTKVSGSSLAPKGFNDAVEKIKAQAKT